MSFSPDWLALRQVADDRARNAGLTSGLARALEGRPALRVLDLGCGTGANMRALAPHLPGRQTWVMADNDPNLLARIETHPGIAVDRRQCDIAADLEELFDPAPDLVTASAFFDLCGRELADRIVRLTAAAGALFHTVLTYDGRESWEPGDPEDDRILACFLDDQRRDKGLGAALGPDAATYLEQAFTAAEYQVQMAASDWNLRAPDDSEMVRELADGHAATARPTMGEGADRWLASRRNASRVIIGHQDLLALPPELPIG